MEGDPPPTNGHSDDMMVDNERRILGSEANMETHRRHQTFRDAVQSSSQWFEEARKIVATSIEWNDEDPVEYNDVAAVKFSKETLTRLRTPWNLTLMGKCLGINVRLSFMTQRVRVMWRPKGTLETIDLGQNIFLFRFSLQDDYERAFFGGPWFILDHYLMITKWKPNFRP